MTDGITTKGFMAGIVQDDDGDNAVAVWLSGKSSIMDCETAQTFAETIFGMAEAAARLNIANEEIDEDEAMDDSDDCFDEFP